MPVTTSNNTKSDGGLLPKTVVLPSSDGDLTNMPVTTSNNTKSDGGLLPKTVVLPSSDGDLTNTTPILPSTTTTGAEEKVRIIQKLGRGGFGETYLASYNKQSVCLKRSICKENEETLRHEHHIMQICNNSNILKSIDLLRNGPDLVLILPLFRFDALRWTESNAWSFDKAKVFAIHLMTGLSYLHNNDLTHNDLKPENLLVNHKQDHLVIGDFGLSTTLTADDHLAGKPRGTCSYFAPECLLREAQQCQLSDVWSSALSMFVLYTRQEFFLSESALERLDQSNIDRRIKDQTFPLCIKRALMAGLQVGKANRRSSVEINAILQEEDIKINLKKMRISNDISVTNEGKTRGGGLYVFFKKQFAGRNVTDWSSEVEQLIRRMLRYISIPIRLEHFSIKEDISANEAFIVNVDIQDSKPIQITHNLAEVHVNESRKEYIINELIKGMAELLALANDDSATRVSTLLLKLYKENFVKH